MRPQYFWQAVPKLATTFTLLALMACSNTSTENPPEVKEGPTTSTENPPKVKEGPTTSTENPPKVKEGPTPSGRTEFICVRDENQGWVTIAQRNNLKAIKPLLVWQTTEFGENWTPERRCNHVTEKLNKAVANNGGYLSNLALTYGPVSNYTVICVATYPGTCTADNMLLTLKPENASKPQEVLAKIDGFAKNRGSDNTILESSPSQYLLLEDLVSRAFPSENPQL